MDLDVICLISLIILVGAGIGAIIADLINDHQSHKKLVKFEHDFNLDDCEE